MIRLIIVLALLVGGAGSALAQCTGIKLTWTPFSQASATTATLIPGVSGKKTYICKMFLWSPTQNVALVEGTGTKNQLLNGQRRNARRHDGGTNSVASGTYATVFGNANLTSGQAGQVGGSQSTDRGRYATNCWGSNEFATQGDAQTCYGVLHGSGSTGSAIRLTADGSGAGSANVVNLPNNSAYALFVDIVAFDNTTVTKNSLWGGWVGLLTRGSNAASTAVTMTSTPTPITNGTLTGQAISITADTTNGGLDISYTPPTSNTDTWHVVARIRTVEVQ